MNRSTSERTAVSQNGLGFAFWAVLDQSVVSLGTFLTSLALARSIAPELYGTFVLIVALILFLNSLQSALVAYPLILRGSLSTITEFRSLATSAVAIGSLLGFFMGCALASICAPVYGASVAACAGLALFFWQLQQIARNVFIAQSYYRGAVPGDVVSSVSQVAFVWILLEKSGLSIASIFAAIALSSFLGLCLQASQLPFHRLDSKKLANTTRDFWHVGRWNFFAAITVGLVSPMLLLSLSSFHGTYEVAGYQAVANVLGASHPVMLSIAGLIIPVATVANSVGSIRDARLAAMKRSSFLVAVLLPFFAILLVFPSQVLNIVYGGESPYSSLVVPLRLLVIAYVFFFVANVACSILNGIERPGGTLVAQGVSLGVAIIIGIPLSASFGVSGASLGIATTFAAWSVAAWMLGLGAEREQVSNRILQPLSSSSTT